MEAMAPMNCLEFIGVSQRKDPLGKMIRVGKIFKLSLENCQSAEYGI